MNGENGSLPVQASRRELVNAVLEGEFMNDQEPTRRKPWAGRVADWWQRSPRVPAVLKSRQLMAQAAKDLVVAILRSPFRFVGAVVRGLVVAVRWWRSWVRIADYRAAAEQSKSWRTSSPTSER